MVDNRICKLLVCLTIFCCLAGGMLYAALPELDSTTTSEGPLTVFTWKLTGTTEFTGYVATTMDDAIEHGINNPIGDLEVYIHISPEEKWTATAGFDAPYLLVGVYDDEGPASHYINPDEFPTENVFLETMFIPTRFCEVTESLAVAFKWPDGEGGFFEDCDSVDFNAVREVRNESWKCIAVTPK